MTDSSPPDADPTDRSGESTHPHFASIELDYETVDRATVIEESVGREIGEIDDGRSRTTLSRTEATVTVDVAARDLIALRAALNTWFSLVAVAESVATVGGQVHAR